MTIDTDLGTTIQSLLSGVGQTVLVTLLAYVVAVLIGLAVALQRLSRHRLLRSVGLTYVEVFRGIPSLVMVLLIFFGLSDVLTLEPLPAAVAGLALVNGAYLAEYFRSGIESVHTGQWEAAHALGLTRRQVFWRIIVPQGIGVAMPPATSQAIGLLKESAVVSAIGVSDITFKALSSSQRGAPPIEVFAVAGLLYLTLSIPIAIFSRTVETRLRKRTAT